MPWLNSCVIAIQQIKRPQAVDYRVCQKNDPTCFLSELHQISTKFDNCWHTDSQDNRIM